MLIGLHGDSRAGKDETAKILVTKYGFEQRVMADPIRQILLEINPLVVGNGHFEYMNQPVHLRSAVTEWGWDSVKTKYPQAVEMMISLGQVARDVISSDVWLAPVLRDLPERCVISDCRQPNEYEAIKELGGEVWKIERQGTVARGMDRLLDDKEFDAVINNDGDLRSLETVVDALMNQERI